MGFPDLLLDKAINLASTEPQLGLKPLQEVRVDSRQYEAAFLLGLLPCSPFCMPELIGQYADLIRRYPSNFSDFCCFEPGALQDCDLLLLGTVADS